MGLWHVIYSSLYSCIYVSLFPSTARHYMKQVVEGLLYLHSHGILHRDLTLANLLLTDDMDAVSHFTSCFLEYTYFDLLHSRCEMVASIVASIVSFSWPLELWKASMSRKKKRHQYITHIFMPTCRIYIQTSDYEI